MRPSLGERRHARVDLVKSDIGGIEDPTISLHHGRAFGMVRLAHGLEELLKSRGASGIFGRGAPFAIDEARVIGACDGGRDLLNLE